MRWIRFATGFLLSVALVSPPAIARADTCSAAKLRAAARAVSGRLNCDAKAEAKGRPGGAAGCETKPNAGLSKDFSKADAKGPCPGSATAVLSVLGDCESTVLAAVGATAIEPTRSRCDSRKVTAVARKAAAKLRCISAQAAKGTDPSPCLSAAETKFAAAIEKLAAATDCSNTSDAASLEAIVDTCVGSAAGTLVPGTTTTSIASSTTSTTTTSTTTTIATTTSTSSTVPTTTSSSTTSTIAMSTTTIGATSTTTTTIPTCHLGNEIQHVVHITFDNVHFTRDNPNVLSDLEQMPALLSFIEGNGTMLSNHHTPLIAHTGDDLLTQYSGVYGDRHGMGISNSYEYYNGTTVTSADSFVYWTSPIIDHASQHTSTTDLNPSMIYSEQVPPVAMPSVTGHAAMTPAPWAPFTKAGCDVGTVSTANMVLEKFADIPTVFGPGSPEAQQLAADSDSFKDAEVDDYVGMSIHCGQSGGINSPLCAQAQAVKFNQDTPTPSATGDILPDEPGGYDNFLALHGNRYLAPVIGGGANVSHNGYQVTDGSGNLVDLDGHTIVGAFKDLHPGQTGATRFNPGFPGFSPSASESLAYVADMLEAGVPVVYGYIADVHDKEFPNGSTTRQTGCSTPGNAMGPGDPCYKENLADYDASFTTFFARLAANGIDKSNTLFIFSAEEQDHYAGASAGRALQPSCTGTPGTLDYTCTYDTTTAPVGEVQLNIHGLIANQQTDTTPFYSEPQGVSIYVTGQQSPDTIRQLERHFSAAVANDPYDSNAMSPVVAYMADPVTEQLLHFTNADPNRTPTFTVFPHGDYFFSSGTTDSCGSGVTADNANQKCSSINSGFAWNHGYYAPQIDITWLGMVGPGVANNGLDGPQASTVRDDSKTVPEESLIGTWTDHTDIRPTMFALLGLQDSHVDDGRVLTEVLTVTPGHTADPRYQPLAVCYKQLNSCVGRFATAALVGDTHALASGSPADDSQYETFLASLTALGAERDALATTIKNDLDGAAFGAGLSADADTELQECLGLVDQAEQLAAAAPTRPALLHQP